MKFNLKENVIVNGNQGAILGRTEYVEKEEKENSYYILVKRKNGSLTKKTFLESEVSPVKK